MRLTSILLNLAKLEARYVEKIGHIPVLAREIVQAFEPQDGQAFLDMTFGGGGHTKHLLATNKAITVFTLDRDPEAFERSLVLAKEVAAVGGNHHQKVVPMLGRFSELPTLLEGMGVGRDYFDGVIMDLGASSFQFDQQRRGFSLRNNGPLDMRMDGGRFPNMPNAADVINGLDAEDLAKIFKAYGEERHSRKIAQAIVDSRFMMKSLQSTQELATLVGNLMSTTGRQQPHDKLGRVAHPATKIFQALRIFVNNELNELDYGLEVVHGFVRKVNASATVAASADFGEPITHTRYDGGLLAAISFHSLEDRIVKKHLVGAHLAEQNVADYKLQLDDHDLEKKKTKPWAFYRHRFVAPDVEEVALNPRARSAKLRLGLCLPV